MKTAKIQLDDSQTSPEIIPQKVELSGISPIRAN